MVQIIKEFREPSTSERFGQAFSNLGKSLAGSLSQGAYQNEQMAKENEAGKRLGIDLSGIKDPETRKKAFETAFQAQSKNQQSFREQLMDQKAYDTIKEQFGEEAAELYKAAPVGGKTHIVKALLEQKSRGTNLKNQLNLPNISTDEMSFDTQEEQKPVFKAVDFDVGLTPKERVARQNERYSKNLPLQQEDFDRLQSLKMQGEELNILEDLSPEIGAIERLNINPKSGELLIPGLASPEAQRFVKTVNDFTTQAKNSYGARVTNFDLQQFMKRLPTLANSEEGRRQIIQQMKLINDINLAYQESLDHVIDEHGGIRNIDYDQAQKIARKVADKKTKELKNQIKQIGKESNKTYDSEIKEKKKNTPKGLVLIEYNGQIGRVPEGELKKALEEGAIVL